MARVALRFAYDGSKFESFARQPRRRTVEGELLRALTQADVVRDIKGARYESASRTDKGVSALANVCAVDTEADPRAIVHRADVPDGLWLLAAVGVEDGFSPRRAAASRSYRYFLEDVGALDASRMEKAARLFVGLHDFGNFCRRESGLTTRRRLDTVDVRSGATAIDFRAPNFLWEQVRRIVHALVSVGKGERTVESVREQLAGKGSPEPPAAPEALVLETVELPVDWPPVSRRLLRDVAATATRARTAARFYSAFASSLPTARR